MQLYFFCIQYRFLYIYIRTKIGWYFNSSASTLWFYPILLVNEVKIKISYLYIYIYMYVYCFMVLLYTYIYRLIAFIFTLTYTLMYMFSFLLWNKIYSRFLLIWIWKYFTVKLRFSYLILYICRNHIVIYTLFKNINSIKNYFSRINNMASILELAFGLSCLVLSQNDSNETSWLL